MTGIIFNYCIEKKAREEYIHDMKWIALLLFILCCLGTYAVLHVTMEDKNQPLHGKTALTEKTVDGAISSEPYYEKMDAKLPSLTMVPYIQEKLTHKKQGMIAPPNTEVPAVSGEEIPPEADTVKIF